MTKFIFEFKLKDPEDIWTFLYSDVLRLVNKRKDGSVSITEFKKLKTRVLSGKEAEDYRTMTDMNIVVLKHD